MKVAVVMHALGYSGATARVQIAKSKAGKRPYLAGSNPFRKELRDGEEVIETYEMGSADYKMALAHAEVVMATKAGEYEIDWIYFGVYGK